MILRWIQNKILQRKHDIVKLKWKKSELEGLLANKDTMTPEEFSRAYQILVKKN